MPQTNPFRKQVMTLLGERYSDKTLVLCPTVFVRLLNGDHKAAILLSQILYWADRTKDKDGWFYKSYADWTLETGLSETQVRRIVNGDARTQSRPVTLRDLGVETMIRKVKHTGAPTLHYRINQQQFLAALQAFVEPVESEHCSGSTPDVAEDEPAEMLAMNTDQSEATLIPSETPSLDQLAEDQDHQSDDDLIIFQNFETRFGKLKDLHRNVFRVELARLGTERVGQVLERCATRGRSWGYVQTALASEVKVEVPSENATAARRLGLQAFSGFEAPNSPDALIKAPQPVSPRIYTTWTATGATMCDAWAAIMQQLEAQLDRSTFNAWVRGASLVDYEAETLTLMVALGSEQAREMLEQRFHRLTGRVVKTVLGQNMQLHFVTTADWAVRFAEKRLAS